MTDDTTGWSSPGGPVPDGPQQGPARPEPYQPVSQPTQQQVPHAPGPHDPIPHPDRGTSGPPRRRGLRIALWSAAAVVVLAGVGGVVWMGHLSSPSAVVRGYVDAVERGDIERAMELDGTVGEPGADSKLLTNELYGLVDDKPHDHVVTDERIDDGKAIVQVAYTQADKRSDVDFVLKRAGTSFLWFDRWVLSPRALPIVVVPVGGSDAVDVTVNDVPTTVDEESTFRVFPGTYGVRFASATGFVRFTDSVVTARWGAKQSAFTSPELTTAGFVEAANAVTSYVGGCAASTEVAPEQCPFSAEVEAGDTVTNVRWMLTSPPDFDIGNYTASRGFAVTTSTPGTMAFTGDYRSPSGESGQLLGEGVDLVVEGIILIDDSGALVFVPYA
ncbi:hypothetical protein [Plantibacter sp. YIM 135347]|uniref:hypothetical protein n=1 Tax=Plantibacter sp. YIM 135347 TaxID=3423919 RepID=UPI003D33C05A